MNEELQARAGVFVGRTVTGVYQTGPTDSQPVGTYPLTGNHEPLTRLNTNENGAVVSFFDNGKWHYMMMVNRSYVAGFDYYMEFKKEIQRINRNGSIEEVGNTIDDHLDGGDCVIVRWK